MADEARLPPKGRIAIVEDEPDLAHLVAAHLAKEGFAAEAFATGRDFLRSLDKGPPDLVLLDLMLPDVNGLDLCRRLRERPAWRSIPVIMLTAKTGEADKVLGLEVGADDYLAKPFSLKELTARIRAVLRRAADRSGGPVMTFGRLLAIDPERFEARVEGRPVELTATEFRILELLASRRGRVLTREQILDAVWGHDKIVLDRTVDVHVKNLREKLGPAGALVKNVRGVGYKIEEDGGGS